MAEYMSVLIKKIYLLALLIAPPMNPAMVFIDTNAFQVVQICITSLLGIFGIAASLNGFLYAKINPVFRVILIVGGLWMMAPGAQYLRYSILDRRELKGKTGKILCQRLYAAVDNQFFRKIHLGQHLPCAGVIACIAGTVGIAADQNRNVLFPAQLQHHLIVFSGTGAGGVGL